mmetsp:Transcript_9031/g.11081  ORF Transcript_9031/g.11081 Transcript_9031/m.11081 type:complete len:159 (+) Transcript_9031:160-636(+)|eukprot:CAMPEP_0172487426 /NCGR_PEP_ID=MMETSP1066-20121228/16527_1 /TAXON_ID=671091 /ORGANISM="Coscinodiscus wailesii, Strain CCMP2513" /LENGTH=158 /DNA_ID=CAMNT_0013254043 /DNA_START=82 /DNA_END=558 /DNA_ORIENTATION=-
MPRILSSNSLNRHGLSKRNSSIPRIHSNELWEKKQEYTSRCASMANLRSSSKPSVSAHFLDMFNKISGKNENKIPSSEQQQPPSLTSTPNSSGANTPYSITPTSSHSLQQLPTKQKKSLLLPTSTYETNESWGHYIDTAEEDELMERYSRVLRQPRHL